MRRERVCVCVRVCVVSVSVRLGEKREGERERGRERWSFVWRRQGGGEKEGWMMTLTAVYIASLVGAAWMALDHLLFKHERRTHLVKKAGRKKVRGGREWEEEEEEEEA